MAPLNRLRSASPPVAPSGRRDDLVFCPCRPALRPYCRCCDCWLANVQERIDSLLTAVSMHFYTDGWSVSLAVASLPFPRLVAMSATASRVAFEKGHFGRLYFVRKWGSTRACKSGSNGSSDGSSSKRRTRLPPNIAAVRVVEWVVSFTLVALARCC